MAITWPAKNNFATGDVLTATQMNNIGDDLNDLNTRVTAAGGFWKNPALNSNFTVWQRGTSVAVTANTPTYTADRWMLQPSGANLASTVSQQATNDTTNLPFIQYCARVQRNSGQTGTAPIYFAQSFENINSTPFIGKTVTLSFYARAGANFSSASNNLSFYLDSATGTNQNVINGAWTGGATPVSSSATLTTTWQRFSATGTVSSTATQLAIRMNYTPVGTAGANDYFEITGVQLEIGSSASSYYPNGNTYQAELAACQRYYYRASASSPASKVLSIGYFYNPSQLNSVLALPVTMRTAPTLIATTGTNYYAWYGNGAATNFNSLTIFDPAENQVGIYSGVSGTTGQAGAIYTANASASVAFNAEL